MEARPIVDCKTITGEGPLWDIREQRIHWVDSLGCKVFRADPGGTNVEMWNVPAKIGSMALRRKGGAILSLQTGVHIIDFATGVCEKILIPNRKSRPRASTRQGGPPRALCVQLDGHN